MLAQTPRPPYPAIIFTSLRTNGDHGYAAKTEKMEALAVEQPGYLGIESTGAALGITVCYWVDGSAAAAWKQVAEHLIAQRRGREAWYAEHQVRIATVFRSYGPAGPR